MSFSVLGKRTAAVVKDRARLLDKVKTQNMASRAISFNKGSIMRERGDMNMVSLLLNEDTVGHGDEVMDLLAKARKLECVVAFAKASFLKLIGEALTTALQRGLTARFVIGLSMHVTDPKALNFLWTLRNKYGIQFYLSNSDYTFHPKIYAFQSAEESTVLIGSANLTQGGLAGNYEASAKIKDADGKFTASVTQFVDGLIDAKEIVLATKRRISDYEKEFIVFQASRKVAEKRAENLRKEKEVSLSVLGGILEIMKRDHSEFGFSRQQETRKENRKTALTVLSTMVNRKAEIRRNFLEKYDSLIRQFHSGGLHRSKTRIAQQSGHFLAAIGDIMGRPGLSEVDAFDLLLGHFQHIPGAGINVLTEILHAIDNKRYAVMNQNAVSGMLCAGIEEYPLHPSKTNVTGARYARYCQQADQVRKRLRLNDFTELDSVFNYAYWDQAGREDEDNQDALEEEDE